MKTSGKGVPYVGGMILEEIPPKLLKKMEVAPDGETVISHSPAVTKFLKKKKYIQMTIAQK